MILFFPFWYLSNPTETVCIVVQNKTIWQKDNNLLINNEIGAKRGKNSGCNFNAIGYS
jgi:hypothetical protein